VEAGFWEKYGSLPMDARDYIYGSVDTRSVYSPPLLLPQAMVMRLYYAIRLIGLISYTLLAWLAVRSIPFGKWILAILAASPVAILQASTISADAISNGIAFLFIGGAIAIANQKEIRWKEWSWLALLFFILFSGKVNIVPLVVLPFIIIPPSRFNMRYGYILLFATTIALFAIEVVGWNLVAYSQLHTAPEGTDPAGQVSFILNNIPEFLSILSGTIRGRWFSYLLDWIAIYGFAYWPVPAWTFYVFAAALIAALFINNNSIPTRTRLGLLFVFIASYIGTYILMYGIQIHRRRARTLLHDGHAASFRRAGWSAPIQADSHPQRASRRSIRSESPLLHNRDVSLLSCGLRLAILSIGVVLPTQLQKLGAR